MSSQAATDFLSGVIASPDVFNVVSTQGRNRHNTVTGDIEINFNSFDEAKYGKVDPRTFNLGSTLIHELHHAATNSFDTDDGSKTGIFRMSYDWISPTVGFVNQMRSERGLPQRAAYVGEPTVFGRKEKTRFNHVNPRHPEKIYYVVRKRF